MSNTARQLRKKTHQSLLAPYRGEDARQIAEEPQDASSMNSPCGPSGRRGDFFGALKETYAKTIANVLKALTGGAPLDEAAATRLRQEQISAVSRTTPSMMLANACNALVLIVAFWGTPRQVVAFCWAIGVLSVVAFHCWRYYRRAPGSKSAICPPRIIYRAIFNALALGLCWAATPLLFFEGSSSGTQLLIACICSGMLCGGAFALANMPLAALAFTAPIVVASAISLMRGAGEDYAPIVAVLGVYTFA